MLKKALPPIPSKMKKIINSLIPVLLALVWMTACQSNIGDEVPRTNEEILEEVKVVKAIGKVVPLGDWAIVSSPTAARILEINVQEGDSVFEGQVLMLLDRGTADLDVGEARARLVSLRADHRTTLEDLQKAQIYVEELSQIYETSVRLQKQNAETREKVDADHSNWKQQKQVVQGLQQRIAAQVASEHEQQMLIERAESELANFSITAPKAGVITDLTVKIGQHAGIADELAHIVDPAHTMVEAEVDELFANDVRHGQQVYLLATGRPDTLARGQVIFTSPVLSDKSILYETANEGEDRRVRRIKIEVDSATVLTINAKVDVNIKIR